MVLRGFFKGLVLQFVNPKVLLYGVTLYITFLAPLLGKPFYVVLSGISLGCLGFSSFFIWGTFGAFINRYFHNPYHQKWVNRLLGALLVYTAITVMGFL